MPPLPPVCITVGDPAGIGPEIIVRTLADPAVMASTPAFVVGPWSVMAQTLAWFTHAHPIDSGGPGAEVPPHGAILQSSATPPPARHRPATCPPATADRPGGQPQDTPPTTQATLRDATGRRLPGPQVPLGFALPRLVRLPSAQAFRPEPGVIAILDTATPMPPLQMGQIHAAAGRVAYDALQAAIDLALARQVRAICTAPLHKEALAAAGIDAPGHTEILAERTGSTDTAMMLVNPTLRVMLVTIHCALREAIERIDTPSVLRIIRLAHRTLLKMGVAAPRIAVAGLNPHAGEGGRFGDEDLRLIAPAIAQARLEGIDASGPHPGDTVFMNARKGRYDLVVAQYHDQGLIPIKLLGVDDGVNVTAGLPFIRTSPDHGTAFDIACDGIADPASLRTALAMAHTLSA